MQRKNSTKHPTTCYNKYYGYLKHQLQEFQTVEVNM